MSDARTWQCDRCGVQMVERRCKVICPNCGARWDCSDVTIWVSDGKGDLVTRACRPSDLPQLARRWPQAPSATDLRDHTAGAWILLEGAEPRGYAVLVPVPGLTHVLQLHGDVDAHACRNGAATLLLDTLFREVDRRAVRQVSYAVDSLQGDDAKFLQAYGFYLEHEEWRMQCELPPPQPAPFLPSGYQVGLLPPRQRIDAFLRLYEQSFSPTPWHQPYSRAEVAADLDRRDELLFLLHESTPVGFAWLRERDGKGEIEPMGLLPAHQGRGLGRALLLTALWRLAARGLQCAALGLWRQNQVALRLYQSAGFRHVGSRYFLAYDVRA